jgi:hypothetical protein
VHNCHQHGGRTSFALAKAMIDEREEINKEKKAQFYFLYGTEERLGITG